MPDDRDLQRNSVMMLIGVYLAFLLEGLNPKLYSSVSCKAWIATYRRRPRLRISVSSSFFRSAENCPDFNCFRIPAMDSVCVAICIWIICLFIGTNPSATSLLQ